MTKRPLDRDAILAMSRSMAQKQPRKAAPAPRPALKVDPAKTDFKTLELYEQIKLQRQAADMLSLADPYFALHEGRAGATTIVDGRELVNFASYDYLGLNGSEEVQKAAKEAIDEFGISVSGSRPTSGNRPFHIALEERLSALYQTEAALVFVSGHSTNVSTIGELMTPADLVVYDAFSHNSITTGCKLSGATRRTFKHNNYDDLERILIETRPKHERVLILVEGLYSMDGDIPDLARLIDIKQRFGAWLMVDEAHSLGVLGETGKGIFEEQDVDPKGVDIWMGTMSKTLSSCGGYICGPQALIDLLKFYASGFMYSVGMPAPVAVAGLASLDLMEKEPWRVTALRDNGQYFLKTAKEAGFNTGLSQGYCVVPIIVGDSLRTATLAIKLRERGIFTVPVTYPAVPMSEARLRFFITATHTREQLDWATRTVAEELKKLEDANVSLASHIGALSGDF